MKLSNFILLAFVLLAIDPIAAVHRRHRARRTDPPAIVPGSDPIPEGGANNGGIDPGSVDPLQNATLQPGPPEKEMGMANPNAGSGTTAGEPIIEEEI